MKKFEYFNQCDLWRIKYPRGESDWHKMMKNKLAISQDAFDKMVDIKGLLAEDEEKLSDITYADPDACCYKSNVKEVIVFFVQSSGFEFIFTEDGLSPEELENRQVKDQCSREDFQLY